MKRRSKETAGGGRGRIQGWREEDKKKGKERKDGKHK